jgi:cephalosporin hydroxylase
VKLTIDTDTGTISQEQGAASETVGLYTPRAFELISRHWIRVGWQQKYSYQFSWMGRPIIQLPDDVLRVQEAIHRLRPDLIMETGVAHGGSLIFYASLCRLLGRGRVIGIDIEIRPDNRRAIETHPLADLITLIEGSSIDPNVCDSVRSSIGPDESVMVLLDSNHSRAHVLAELEAYHPFVTPGSYIVATDGLMHDLSDVPGGSPEWASDNPVSAVADFLVRHPEFAGEAPVAEFNESSVQNPITYWPNGWLRRLR